jgi:hypothetical protein
MSPFLLVDIIITLVHCTYSYPAKIRASDFWTVTAPAGYRIQFNITDVDFDGHLEIKLEDLITLFTVYQPVIQ